MSVIARRTRPAGRPPGAASRRRRPRARSRSATSARASRSGRSPRSASRRGSRARTPWSRSRPGSPGAASGSRSVRPGAGSRRGSPRSARALRGRRREQRRDRTGLDRREDREVLDRREVVGHQVDDLVGGGAEGLGIHVEEAVGLLDVECLGRSVVVTPSSVPAWPSGQGEAPRQRVVAGPLVPGEFDSRCAAHPRVRATRRCGFAARKRAIRKQNSRMTLRPL